MAGILQSSPCRAPRHPPPTLLLRLGASPRSPPHTSRQFQEAAEHGCQLQGAAVESSAELEIDKGVHGELQDRYAEDLSGRGQGKAGSTCAGQEGYGTGEEGVWHNDGSQSNFGQGNGRFQE